MATCALHLSRAGCLGPAATHPTLRILCSRRPTVASQAIPRRALHSDERRLFDSRVHVGQYQARAASATLFVLLIEFFHDVFGHIQGRLVIDHNPDGGFTASV